MNHDDAYYIRPAVAFIRSQLPADATEIAKTQLAVLSQEQINQLIQLGLEQGLKLHRFKKTMGLPRVSKVIGYLHAFYPQTILDIGTGRGVFLWPFMETFPKARVSSLDILDYRINFLDQVKRGGMPLLNPELADITKYDAPDSSFDAVTFLETLEHIPEPEKALLNAVRLAGRVLILSVPSKEDNNPEHLHLLREDFFRTTLSNESDISITFDYVPGHMIIVISKSNK